jgi:hypothetical protein
MPDADLDQVVNDLAGAAFGSAGERCMALPVVVPVGDDTADALREKLIPAIEGLRVGVSTDPDAHYGPVVSAAHRKRIEDYISWESMRVPSWSSMARGFTLQGHEQGFFIGPTFFDHVKPSMKSYQTRFSAPCCRWSGRRNSKKRSASRRASNMATASRSSPATATPRASSPRASMSAWSASTCRSRCRSLPQLRRLEALGLRRHRPVRHGRRALLDQEQGRHPALARRRAHGESAFIIPTMA